MKLRQNKLVPLTLEDRSGIPSAASWGDPATGEFSRLIEKLDTIRRDWLEASASKTYASHCLDLPGSLLSEYSTNRNSSRLGDVFVLANRLQSKTDRVVFAATGDSQRIVRTFLDACCDPHWNELTRAERGSKPRVYFVGDSLDNDATQGVLQMIARQRPVNRSEEYAWGAVALKTCEEHPGFEAAQNQIRAQLSFVGNESLFCECLPRISSDSIPDLGLPPALLVFTPIGMLPAAILGINIMELLAGAAAMTRAFVSTEAMQNPILRWVAWNHLANTRRVAIWNDSLQAASEWLRHLYRAQGLENASPSGPWRFVFPLKDSLTDQDLESCSHIWVEQSRFDALSLEPAPSDEVIWDPRSDRPRRISPEWTSDPTYVDSASALFQAVQDRQNQSGGFGQTLRLPDLGELSLGQWMQWMIIASLLESALVRDT